MSLHWFLIIYQTRDTRDDDCSENIKRKLLKHIGQKEQNGAHHGRRDNTTDAALGSTVIVDSRTTERACNGICVENATKQVLLNREIESSGKSETPNSLSRETGQKSYAHAKPDQLLRRINLVLMS